jgi:cell filamentation protein, protein adenylyltransferase
MSFDPSIPYNDLPPLPPPVEKIETARILKKCISARVALAELKQAAELIPNASVLANALPLLEAQASSEIENIVTTTDKLLEFVDAPDKRAADPATKEALRYRRALFEGVRKVQSGRIRVATAIDVCRTIKDENLDLRSEPGTMLRNMASGKVIYTPPEGQKLIREKLGNWEEFLGAPGDLDPLIRCAVQHYQFEAIHPFTDGNGRTGRVLNILYLVQEGLLDTPILYLSRYIIRHKADYYRLLLEVTTEQRWGPWVLFMLDCIENTCVWTTEKIKAIRDFMRHTGEFVRRRLPKIYSWELVELLFRQPYCRIAHIVDAGIAKRQTASVYLKSLAEIGVLREINAGRESLFVHPKYIELLTGEDNVWVFYAGVETDHAIELSGS